MSRPSASGGDRPPPHHSTLSPTNSASTQPAAAAAASITATAATATAARGLKRWACGRWVDFNGLLKKTTNPNPAPDVLNGIAWCPPPPAALPSADIIPVCSFVRSCVCVCCVGLPRRRGCRHDGLTSEQLVITGKKWGSVFEIEMVPKDGGGH